MAKTGKSLSEIDRLNSEYWDGYYKSGKASANPSEFAKFCLPFMNKCENVIDVGCGNGRDTFYFAQNQIFSLGIDRSKNAIINNLDIAASNPLFLFADLTESWSENQYLEWLGKFNNVYCRWILHAISKTKETVILEWIKQHQSKNCKLFIECRSVMDELCNPNELEHIGKNEYYTDHYRRFIAYSEIVDSLNKLNYHIIYDIQSKGLSPMEGSDPELIRIVAVKK